MPQSEPRKETRTIQVIDLDNDAAEEIIPVSDLDCIMPKIYVPITETYKLADTADKEGIVETLLSGLQSVMKEYRFLAGTIHVDTKGIYTIRRGAHRPTFTVHVAHLEHTDFPSYAELEARGFPITELDDKLLPAGYSPSLDTKPGDAAGMAATFVQINLIRGGLVLATAIHHLCVDARGFDAVVARWAAHTRAHYTGELPPPFDPSCLDPSPLNSTSPLPPDQFAAVERRIKNLRYSETPQPEAPAGATTPVMLHFARASLDALKASVAARVAELGRWVSTNDVVTALMWRAELRCRLAKHGVAADDAARRVRLLQSLDVREYNKMPTAYPGNVVAFSCVENTVARVLGRDTLGEVAIWVRDAVNAYRDPNMSKDMMDYVAACPNRSGVQFNFDVVMGLDSVVTSWRVVTAYETHDFGFGPPQALRWCSTTLDGYTFYYPARPADTDREAWEVYVSMEKGCMEMMLQDEELLRWATVSGR